MRRLGLPLSALLLTACPAADDGSDDELGTTGESGTTGTDSSGTDSTSTDATDTSDTSETGDTGGLMGELVCDLGSAPVAEWTRHTVADDLVGPAFVSVADVDEDGKQDLVTSSFGAIVIDGINITLSPGSLHLHMQREDLGCWERVEIAGPDAGIYFPNETELADLDADGDLDVVLASGFFLCGFDPSVLACGGLYVFTNEGDHFERHDLVHAATQFHHRPALVDFDGDGDLDIVTGAETNMGGRLIWYAGDGAGGFAAEPFEIDPDATGTIPDLADIDGDGDLDLAAARYFGVDAENPPYLWWERTADPSQDNPAGTFVRHVISEDHGPGIMLRLSDALYGDGVVRAVASNHVNQANANPDAWESAVLVFEPGADPTQPWPSTIISSGILSVPDVGLAQADAPGVFDFGDADGDGDLDVFVSGDGDPRTFWLEQTAPDTFTTHVIEDSLAQAGGGHAVDLDGDGDVDPVFTGYEDDRIYVYER